MAWGIVWSNDSHHLYYTTYDDLHRSYRLFRHKLGNQQSSDELLYEEKDKEFLFYLERACLISDSFIVLTNRHLDKKYINNILLRSPISQEGNEKDWTRVIPYEESHYITGVNPLENHLVLEERVGGYTQLRVIKTSSGAPLKSNGHLIKFPVPIFTISAKQSYMQYSSTELFFKYSSFTNPDSLFKYDLATRIRTLFKTDPVLGNFDSKKYSTERVIAPNNVPISLPSSSLRIRELWWFY
ncbi:hypothetical protein DSO57_1032343 [Entomophthora muscae]|uniref:Uncharacterized protein n=1 Tax=Entomophthora muscae TaxID=34485 RepID=A0ACC2SPK7_9FUNG|nr:hypothetical protein DSO57_1032343 [Entomophthora muscae]